MWFHGASTNLRLSEVQAALREDGDGHIEKETDLWCSPYSTSFHNGQFFPDVKQYRCKLFNIQRREKHEEAKASFRWGGLSNSAVISIHFDTPATAQRTDMLKIRANPETVLRGARRMTSHHTWKELDIRPNIWTHLKKFTIFKKLHKLYIYIIFSC